MKITVKLNNYRRSAQKVRELFRVIKGLDVEAARMQLVYARKGATQDVKKLLESAIANAQNNHGLDKENLVVSEVYSQESRTLKRWRPRAFGRAGRILKRTCNIVLVLSEKKETDIQKIKKTGVTEVKKEKGTEKQVATDTGSKADKKKAPLQDKKDRGKTFAPQGKVPKTSGGMTKIFRKKAF